MRWCGPSELALAREDLHVIHILLAPVSKLGLEGVHGFHARVRDTEFRASMANEEVHTFPVQHHLGVVVHLAATARNVEASFRLEKRFQFFDSRSVAAISVSSMTLNTRWKLGSGVDIGS